MQLVADELVGSLPDFSDWNMAAQAVPQLLGQIHRMPALEASAAIASLSLQDLTGISEFGPAGSRCFRQALFGILVADWACYHKLVDRVALHRLSYSASVFPAGFRLWLAKPGEDWLPIGYSGWYPIAESALRRLELESGQVRDRGEAAPVRTVGGAIYVFNYSIIPQGRSGVGSNVSRLMLRQLASDLDQHKQARRAAITVSEDGSRVARRFGMIHVGDICIDGEPEMVFMTPTR